jgi:hypothetical protein
MNIYRPKGVSFFTLTETEVSVESLPGEPELKSFGGIAEEIPAGKLERHG